MVFVKMEKYSWSRWDVWRAFIHKWASHACCKLRVYLHVSACHLPLCVAPQCGSQRGVPIPLNTRDKQSLQDANRPYASELHTTHGSPLKPMGTAYRTQSQGYGNTASLSYPDTWVRKPDCLHLPYKHISTTLFNVFINEITRNIFPRASKENSKKETYTQEGHCSYK